MKNFEENKTKQKGMFFGLDARIALAIFCVLSLLSGVVLHKALQKVESVSVIRRIDSLSKAKDFYFVDTKSNIFDVTLFSFYSSSDPNPNPGVEEILKKLVIYISANASLLNNVMKDMDWNGPYITYETMYSDNILLSPMSSNNILSSQRINIQGLIPDNKYSANLQETLKKYNIIISGIIKVPDNISDEQIMQIINLFYQENIGSSDMAVISDEASFIPKKVFFKIIKSIIKEEYLIEFSYTDEPEP